MKIFLFLSLFSFCVQAADPQGIQVQGNCDIKVAPDRGSVTFTVENQKLDQKEAVKKTNQQITQLRERLQKLNLADMELKTTSYNVFLVRDWEKDRFVDKGYKASMGLELQTSEISRLGEAMMEASKSAVQNVGTMVTFLSPEKARAEYLKCLDVASDDARKKAEQLAKKLGFKVGDVLNVIESPLAQPRPLPVYEARRLMAKGMGDAPAAPVDPGTHHFSTTLQVVFAIK